MRQDQYEKLQSLSERLTDVFLQEADSDKWPGHQLGAIEMGQQTRGDRYWCKKNAVATLTLIQRVATLTGIIQRQSNEGSGAAVVEEEESMLDAAIKDAEKEATKLLNKLQDKKEKAHFDKKVHGKS